MRVGLFNPYLDTLGGGERYFFTVVEYFLKKDWEVDIFWPNSDILEKVKQRFNINLAGANFINTPFKSFGYDVTFFVSDGSIPLCFSKKNIIHFQVPFTKTKNILNTVKLLNATVVCNSLFTKQFIDKTYGVNSKILYPPIDIENFSPGKKENIILAVGRFFAPMHPKKQEMMVETFLKMKTNWELVLIGGVTGEQSFKSVEELRNKTKDHNVKIITDGSMDVLKKYYSKAKIFWHATGFGEDLQSFPEKAEHFGMTTVEAMAAGCTPIVFAGGGQPEIVADRVSGYLWKTEDELLNYTYEVMKNDKNRKIIADKAKERAVCFSKQKFYEKMEDIINS